LTVERIDDGAIWATVPLVIKRDKNEDTIVAVKLPTGLLRCDVWLMESIYFRRGGMGKAIGIAAIRKLTEV
jgi:hypothetical protein